MGKRILLGIGAFFVAVLTLAIGIALGMTIYSLVLYQATVETMIHGSSVERGSVPVEETQVIPIEHDGKTGN